MTKEFSEGNLVFRFPDDSVVFKYDDCNFHSRHWSSFAGGSKAVDFIVGTTNGSIWFIEVKDYRTNPRTKPSDLFDEIAVKVRDSIAAMQILALRQPDSDDKELAKAILRQGKVIRVVLHLEQPLRHSKLFPQIIDWKTAKDCLKRALKTVDPRCLVGNTDLLKANVIWSVHNGAGLCR